MSIRNMEIVWHYAPYKGEKLLVLLALADWSNSEGVSWPSYPKLAAKARITERGAMGIIDALVCDGALHVEKGGGRGATNHYRIDLKKIRSKGEAETLNELHGSEKKGELGSAERVNEDAEKGERGDTPNKRSVIDPSVQPSGQKGLFDLKQENSKAKAWHASEVAAYFKEIGLPESDGVWFWDKMVGSGWKNGGQKVADWKATVRAWKTAGHLPSSKIGKSSTTPVWRQRELAEEDIAKHPANPKFVGYMRDSVTAAQREHLLELRGKLESLKEQERASIR